MTSDPPTRSRLKRLLAPTWPERKRALHKQSWFLVAVAYAALVFASAYPLDLRNTATRHADAIRDAGVHDALDGTGAGLAATWPVHSFTRYLPVPGLRIDHVYCSKQWRTVDAATGDGRGSDHRPLIVRLGLGGADVR